jgi:hypothetical protein
VQPPPTELPAEPPGPLALELRVRWPTAPAAQGLGNDRRLLGVLLHGLQVEPVPPGT